MSRPENLQPFDYIYPDGRSNFGITISFEVKKYRTVSPASPPPPNQTHPRPITHTVTILPNPSSPSRKDEPAGPIMVQNPSRPHLRKPHSLFSSPALRPKYASTGHANGTIPLPWSPSSSVVNTSTSAINVYAPTAVNTCHHPCNSNAHPHGCPTALLTCVSPPHRC